MSKTLLEGIFVAAATWELSIRSTYFLIRLQQKYKMKIIKKTQMYKETAYEYRRLWFMMTSHFASFPGPNSKGEKAK